MKKTIIFISALLALVVGTALFFVFNSFIYNQKQADESIFNLGSYGYRCGDGTEFSMSPSADMATIRITPATSVERIPKTIISRVQSDSGARYEGNGIVFFAHGETVQLSTDAFSTSCMPMTKPDEAPFNFGD